ncbi:hypothetical protein CARUB_v10011775mg [Capsella rubella]|uniref:Plant thionin family protein n=1 Tax=Capsella rubella TaxID=81985 RepID=R0GLE7_9BRAS|nr:uncharacterized protein LOC17897426 [Capsella rubella]EOA36586.1 hypothetical protein CARUB_v10011775mg [Capsella rubella]
MAGHMSQRICNILIIVTLATMMFSAQIAESNKIALQVCLHNCVTNVCMKAGKKATPAKCKDACSQVCDDNPFNNEGYVVPPGKGDNPLVKFCKRFPWICS